jgi:serine protease Do
MCPSPPCVLPKKRTIIRCRLVCALVSAFLIAIAVAAGASAQAPKATTLEKVSSRTQPGIVYMETSYSGLVWDSNTNEFVGGESPREFSAPVGSCSGFFVNPDGYFVTAGHCVEYHPRVDEAIIEQAAEWLYQNDAQISNHFTLDVVKAYADKFWTVRSAERPDRRRPDRDVAAAYGVDIGGLPTGKALPARLLGFRAFHEGDVALLKLEAEDVPVLKLAPETDVEVGTEIVSIGYPGSVDLVTDVTFDPSFKEGSVSSKKTIRGGLLEVYEISAAASSGMSGGPTVDRHGRVVGVTSFRPAGETQPFNFVTPAAEVTQLLRDKGVKNRLGRTNSAYLEGLEAYYAGDREEALAKFNEVLDLVREHEFAQKFRAKALRLPEEEQGGFPLALLVVVAGIAGVVAGAAVLLYRRRRGPAAPPSPPEPQPDTPPVAPVTVTGNGASRSTETAPTLVIMAGPLAGRRISLDSELVLGQSTINDDQVSAQHAAVTPRDGGVQLTDLGSRNGTMVNGARVEGSAQVANGDVITLGRTTIMVERPG